MHARSSSVAADETPQRAGSKGIRGLPADNLGQMTPIGMAHQSSESSEQLSERLSDR